MRKRMQKRKWEKGQAIVEYIIIVVIVAVGALTIMGFFSDTIKEKMSGVISALGGSAATEAQGEATTGGSLEALQDLDATGGDIAQ